MDLIPDIKEGEEPPTKKFVIPSKGSKDQQQILILLAKLALSSAMQERVLKSVIVRSYKIPVEHWICKACKMGTAAFQAAQTKKREEGMEMAAIKDIMGPPN
eukprot:12119834-Karenia_brevis.AAC.1